MKHSYRIPNKTLITIFFIFFLCIFANSFAQNKYDKIDIKEAEKIALKHSEFMINRDFINATKLILPSDLKQLEQDFLMILNEGKEYGIMFPFFYSEMNSVNNKPAIVSSDGSILIKYYEKAYGNQTKDYHKKVVESLKVIETKIISSNTVKVKYSFNAYGAEEPVNLEYDKTLIFENDHWYVTKDLPEGRMIANFKSRIEAKKKSVRNNK